MKRKKISTIIMITVIILEMGNVYAAEIDKTEKITETVSVASSKIDTDVYKPQELTEKDYEKAFDMTSNIIGPITIVGIVISITMIMILGVKYMLGSIEEKAEYKKTMVPMLIGAILLFTSSTMVSIIYQLVEQL